MDLRCQHRQGGPWVKVLEAVPAMLVIYFTKTVFAYAITAPLTAASDSYLSHAGTAFGAIQEGPYRFFLLPELLWDACRRTVEYAPLFLTTLVFYLFLSPFFSMLWLHALASSAALPEICRAAARLYYQSFKIQLLYLTGLALVIALSAFAIYLIRAIPLLPDDDRTTDLVAVACLLAAMIGSLYLLLLYDASTAELLVSENGIRSVAVAFQTIHRVGRILSFLAWHGLLALVAFAGILVSGWAEASGVDASVIGLLLAQLLVFGRMIARGRWLATLV
jgi:hypothetical protein